jgi:hypothetical protein
MIYSKQTLIQKALGLEEKLIDEGLVTMLSEKKPEFSKYFKALLLEAESDDCPGISFSFEKEIITFKFSQLSDEQSKACSELFAFINKNAKVLKHASFKPAQEENPKYGFRTWLTRLGVNSIGKNT